VLGDESRSALAEQAAAREAAGAWLICKATAQFQAASPPGLIVCIPYGELGAGEICEALYAGSVPLLKNAARLDPCC